MIVIMKTIVIRSKRAVRALINERLFFIKIRQKIVSHSQLCQNREAQPDSTCSRYK